MQIPFDFDDIDVIVSQINSCKTQKISILLPYYNESTIIVQNTHYILNKMLEWGLDFEIIISDDGSQDNGFDLLLQEFKSYDKVKLIRSVRNYGKGRALSTAYERSSGELVLFLDCDLELPIEHLPYFLLQMLQENADVVIGSKEHPSSNIEYPVIRKIFSKGYYLITKVLFNLRVQDTQTGIKLFKREVLEKTLPYLLIKRFAFDIELLALITHYSYKIVSHPIVLHYTRNTGIGRMSLDTILHMLKDTVATFWRLKSCFWQNSIKGKTNLKYALLTLDKSNNPDAFQITEWSEIIKLKDVLKSYDIIIFQQKQEEIPVFIQDSLNRIFIDESVDIVLPTLYSYGEGVKEELHYALLGNIFYEKGLYSRYRPVRQYIIQELQGAGLTLLDFVYRREILFELLDQHIENIDMLGRYKIIQTPYSYTHRIFPQNYVDFQSYTKKMTSKIGVKKIASALFSCSVILVLVALLTQFYWLVLPWLLIEFGIVCWYIYSLGIRKGIRFIFLFYEVRVRNFIDKFFSLKK